MAPRSTRPRPPAPDDYFVLYLNRAMVANAWRRAQLTMKTIAWVVGLVAAVLTIVAFYS